MEEEVFNANYRSGSNSPDLMEEVIISVDEQSPDTKERNKRQAWEDENAATIDMAARGKLKQKKLSFGGPLPKTPSLAASGSKAGQPQHEAGDATDASTPDLDKEGPNLAPKVAGEVKVPSQKKPKGSSTSTVTTVKGWVAAHQFYSTKDKLRVASVDADGKKLKNASKKQGGKPKTVREASAEVCCKFDQVQDTYWCGMGS